MSLLASQTASKAWNYLTPPRALEGDTLAASWVTRGTHFIVCTSLVSDGARLTRDNPDEYLLIVPPQGGLSATLRAGADCVEAVTDSLSILPPGRSEIEVHGTGYVVRIFSADAADLLALAGNAAAYATPNPDVAPLAPWPDPVGGFRLRTYALEAHRKPDSNMRVFRTCKLMVNMILPRVGARDIHKLTPHVHQDFEQGSLALDGSYIHHLRYPWVPDMDQWHPDDHVEMNSPSLIVIPPKVIHTSRCIGTGTSQLVDIFAPPRVDFSQRGLVCNADDYPMPSALQPSIA
ncbi:hypothetical protein [Paraburkholderia sp. J41]|uniref:hypothetical protein n=1 Tax=Paraburkholderia sp. J41 TaxID=2805433 RepID=UPI002AC36493|nr:hypothetical protein [Paraburkholderia sp. J41]